MSSEPWSLVIKPHTKWWDIHMADVWRYRDLLWLFVRRDFVAVYAQTVLGPAWFFIQPLLTTVMFTVIFSGIAKIPTDGFPPILFYLAGMTPWAYFAACLTKTSNTFVSNAGLFGKVYFPRLILPLSVVASNLIQFAIQFVLFLSFLAWFSFQGAAVSPDLPMILLLTPALLVLMGLLGLGTGIAISSLTTKYRDLAFLVSFGVQLAMYATPIIYPMSSVPAKYQWIIHANPMSAIIETFRAVYLGGTIPWSALGISTFITLVLLVLGILIFHKVEKTFMDTV
jgi:lipopolysaccharide transport system permease protein